MLVLGLVLGAIAATPSDDSAAQNLQMRAEVAQLKTQVDELTSERDDLKAQLDPIRQAEEASAAAAAATEGAAAKAKADAEAAAAATAEQAAALEAANTFTDGIYLVGEDIKPGTYRGTVTSDMGYWARLRNTDGGLDSIIANGLPSGPFVLTIKSSDNAVELKGVKLVRK